MADIDGVVPMERFGSVISVICASLAMISALAAYRIRQRGRQDAFMDRISAFHVVVATSTLLVNEVSRRASSLHRDLSRLLGRYPAENAARLEQLLGELVVLSDFDLSALRPYGRRSFENTAYSLELDNLLRGFLDNERNISDHWTSGFVRETLYRAEEEVFRLQALDLNVRSDCASGAG